MKKSIFRLVRAALNEMSESEQDNYFTDGLDPAEVMKMEEESRKSKKAQSKGGRDAQMGDALAEESGGGVGLPMTMPQGMSRKVGGMKKLG